MKIVELKLRLLWQAEDYGGERYWVMIGYDRKVPTIFFVSWFMVQHDARKLKGVKKVKQVSGLKSDFLYFA